MQTQFIRRLRIFKTHKRGYYSACLFALVLLISIMAPLIANEKPIMVYTQGKLYFPILKPYTEQEFGGILQTQANYRDPEVKAMITKSGWALFAPIAFSPQTINYTLPEGAPSAPTTENWLGTDDQGRDVATRLLYGLRMSVFFGIALTLVSAIIGVLIGGAQGYLGGKIDLIGQRLTEIWQGLPVLYVLMILSSLIIPGFWWLLGIMMLFNWMMLANVIRAEFVKTRSQDYIKAARSLGLSTYTILTRHMLPNAMVTLITYIPFLLNASISTLTSLDFLGFGLPSGEPSLGELVLQAKNNPNCWWIGFTAFLSIASLLTMLSFIAEGLRDALDPRS